MIILCPLVYPGLCNGHVTILAVRPPYLEDAVRYSGQIPDAESETEQAEVTVVDALRCYICRDLKFD